MLPPWKAYPKLNENSLGWRMGPGEYYWIEFKGFYGQLPPEQRADYERQHGEPQGWNGFYARLQSQGIALDRKRMS